MKMVFYYTIMSSKRYMDGNFIPEKHRAEWNQKKRKKVLAESCGCQDSPFFFETCIVHSQLVDGMDVDSIYDEVVGKLKGRVSASDFSGLSQSHKRWCFYWYYAVTYFHLKGVEATPLPECFIASVRNSFPDANGNYTGHKSSSERSDNVEY